MSEKISDFDYPKWKYHATEKPRVVNSAKEEAMLGPNWENSPAYFKTKKEEPKETEIKKNIKEKLWQLLGI